MWRESHDKSGKRGWTGFGKETQNYCARLKTLGFV